MAAGRHNLTRRALLGAAAGVCGDMYLYVSPSPARARGQLPATVPTSLSAFGGQSASDCPFARALAAYRRAEARVAAFKAEEALLPEARRAFPCDDLEEEFGRLDGLRLAALRRLLRLPAPNLAALALKLDLADSAWELTGCESCLAALAADAQRLSALSAAR